VKASTSLPSCVLPKILVEIIVYPFGARSGRLRFPGRIIARPREKVNNFVKIPQTPYMQKKIYPLLLVILALTALAIHAGAHAVRTQAVFSYAEEKTVYLTFDDGPSTVVTGRILDTLHEENIKATFFIVSDRVRGREDTLRRIAAEGHTLGVHSATHDYKAKIGRAHV